MTAAPPPGWLPRPEDELLHTPVGDESLPWKDTWYFSLRDDASDALIAMHMTISANRSPDTRVAVGVRCGNREWVEVLRSDGVHTDTVLGNDLARIEVVNLSWDSDHELRWRGALPELDFDVTVRGRHFAPLWDTMFDGYHPTGKQGHSYGHAEQVIVGEGWLRCHGEPERRFSGFGWRDRGWGRRKSELTFNSGYDLIGAILPDDSVFSFTLLRNVELPPGEPTPVAAWLADATSLVPAVSGIYHKDSMSFPARVDLEFLDGRRVVGTQRRRTATLGTPFHEAEPERSGIAHGARDYYAVFADPDGAEFGVFSNEGHMLRADVTRDTTFLYHESLAPAS